MASLTAVCPVRQHLARAEANWSAAEAVLEKLDDCVHDWAIVIRFYSALHYLDGYLANKNIKVDSHGLRKKQIRANTELSKGKGRRFRKAYMALQDRSEQIRYDAGYKVSVALLEQSELDLRVVVSFLRPLLRHGQDS